MSLDDKDLVTLLTIDLNSYFILLVQTYQHKLYALALRMTRNQQDAEDIVQDTFMRAHAALAKFSATEKQHLKIRPWLFKITYHLTINHINRDGKLQSQLTSIDLPENREAFEKTGRGQWPSPEDEIERNEKYDELQICLNSLSNTLRVPVILHYIVGLKYAEIAVILDQPFHTVKSNGYRGLKKLNEMLKQLKFAAEEVK